MASRYLVATGNWSDPSIWSATSGGAGGASVPTTTDYAYIDSGYTVTLTADASVGAIEHTYGTLSLASYRLLATYADGWSGYYSYGGAQAKTLDLSDGILEVTSNNGGILGSGSNLTVNAGNSLVILNIVNSGSDSTGNFATGSFTYNDVRINLGTDSAAGTTCNITGSPHFRLLEIRSANSAAHTVNFDSGATITTDKFVAIGSSSSDKLSIHSTSLYPPDVTLAINNSSYGQFVDMGVEPDTGTGTPLYIGANSVDNSWNGYWLTQDPPKISTLVDPLTTDPASNTNWTVTGTTPTTITSGAGGGGYSANGGTAALTSVDTYDIVDSSLVVEICGPPSDFSIESIVEAMLSTSGLVGVELNALNTLYRQSQQTESPDTSSYSFPAYGRISVSSSALKVTIDVSDDGIAWTNALTSDVMPDDNLVYYRSLRAVLSLYYQSFPFTANGSLGSINPSLGTVETNTQSSVANIIVASIETKTQTSKGRLSVSASSTITSKGYIRGAKSYSYGTYDTLPTDNSTLSHVYTSGEITDVDTEDSVYVDDVSNKTYAVHLYATHSTDNLAKIEPTWIGKSTRPATAAPIKMQIYNVYSGGWEDLASDTTAGAGDTVTLTGSQTIDTENYYDSDGFSYVRVHQ